MLHYMCAVQLHDMRLTMHACNVNVYTKQLPAWCTHLPATWCNNSFLMWADHENVFTCVLPRAPEKPTPGRYLHVPEQGEAAATLETVVPELWGMLRSSSIDVRRLSF
jgi:hypothetical protein